MSESEATAKSTVAGVCHVGVTVASLKTARRFYVDGIGCEEVAAQRSSASYLSVTGYEGVTIDALFARVPGSELVLEIQEYQDLPGRRGQRSPGTSRPGSSHICLTVDDLEAALERLEDFGGTRVTDPVDIDGGINKGSRAVYLRDPDGYTLELFEPSKRDANDGSRQ